MGQVLSKKTHPCYYHYPTSAVSQINLRVVRLRTAETEISAVRRVHMTLLFIILIVLSTKLSCMFDMFDNVILRDKSSPHLVTEYDRLKRRPTKVRQEEMGIL